MPENAPNASPATIPLDLEPAADLLADLVRRVPDEALARPTPCPEMSLRELLDHVSGFALTFTAAARRTERPVPSEGGRPGDDWPARLPAELAELAEAWRDPQAWEGSTEAAGVPLPGATAGLFALDELVVHGWDLAVAAGLPYDPDPVTLQALHDFVADLVARGRVRPGLWEPPVPVSADASLLERTLALTGRDPRWSAP
jgi:uncharacterized protein (TIGR03086 family)